MSVVAVWRQNPYRAFRIAWILGAVLLALLLRSTFIYGDVFLGDRVTFVEGDALFHMRTAQNLIENFPWRSQFDPYGLFPSGLRMPTAPLFDYLVAICALVLGLGSPSPHLVDVVGAWASPVLSALLAIPVYRLTRLLFDRVAACFAVVLVAISPGALTFVSRLGFADHHALEVLLATTMVWFLCEAFERERSRVRWTIGAGLALAGYLSTRAGGAFVVGVLAAWGCAQIWIDVLNARGPYRVWRILSPVFGTALVVAGPAQPLIWGNLTVISLLAGFAGVSVCALLGRFLGGGRRFGWSYAAVVAVLAVAGYFALDAIAPEAIGRVTRAAARALEDNPARSLRELRPTLELGAGFSIGRLFEGFGTGLFLGAPVLVFHFRRVWREPAFSLFWFWSLTMTFFGFAQLRMTSYSVVALAPLAGLVVSRLLEPKGTIRRAAAFAVVVMLALAPNVAPAIELLQERAGISSFWLRTYKWLRTETPEPLSDPGAYTRWYPALEPGASFDYPESAYGVMAWWDHGYRITTLAGRIPVTTGTQENANLAARFLIETEHGRAREVLDRVGARYVMVDRELPVRAFRDRGPGNSKFAVIPPWDGEDSSRFVEICYETDSAGRSSIVTVFHPDYYRSMMARLYLFDGEAVEPKNSSWAIRAERTPQGSAFSRRILEKQRFPSYQEAEDFVSERGDEWLLVGLSPTESAVPLEATRWLVKRYQATRFGEGDVKIFEVADDEEL